MKNDDYLKHIREKIIDKTGVKNVSIYDNCNHFYKQGAIKGLLVCENCGQRKYIKIENEKLMDALNELHNIALNSFDGTYRADTLYEVIISELENETN